MYFTLAFQMRPLNHVTWKTKYSLPSIFTAQSKNSKEPFNWKNFEIWSLLFWVQWEIAPNAKSEN